MVYSLLFSLPGTPTLYYGEEIGMAEDLEAEGRMAVRTPMQWSAGRNGGFSTAPPRRLVQRPVPGVYGSDRVNVAQQQRDPDSLWTFLRTLIQTYRDCPELGWGDFRVLRQPHREVLAHQCSWQGLSTVAVHNLSPHPVTTRLYLETEGEVRLDDLFAHESIEAAPDGTLELALDGFGHRWLRVRLSQSQ
jgi:glycosidase